MGRPGNQVRSDLENLSDGGRAVMKSTAIVYVTRDAEGSVEV